MNVFPFNQTVETAQREVLDKGGVVFQQFLCEKCGAKQTMEDQNKFYTKGKCEECKHTTDLVKNGCAFMAVFGKK